MATIEASRREHQLCGNYYKQWEKPRVCKANFPERDRTTFPVRDRELWRLEYSVKMSFSTPNGCPLWFRQVQHYATFLQALRALQGMTKSEA